MREFSTGMYEFLSLLKKFPPSICGGHVQTSPPAYYNPSDFPWKEAEERKLAVTIPCPMTIGTVHFMITPKGEVALMILQIINTKTSISLG